MTITMNMRRELVEEMLLRSLARGRLSHAYLFTGPKGSGKLLTAVNLAKAMLCLERSGSVETKGACGRCGECRKVDHGNHPDVIRIRPDGAVIKIEQIRELQRGFAYRAAGARPRIYIMEESDKMTVQAANSLLKFLEEPGEGIVAVLLTEQPNALLPTIASRVQRIPFAPLEPPHIARQLIAEGAPEHLAHAASQLAAGIDAAKELVQSESFAECRNVVIQLAKEMIHSPAKSLVTLQQRVFRSQLAEQVETILSLFGLLFKDIIHVQARMNAPLSYPDHAEWLNQMAVRTDAGRWVRALEFVMEARKQLRAHVNPQLVLERFMVAVQEV
jgi:DNA polymerase-3 subunit delta'